MVWNAAAAPTTHSRTIRRPHKIRYTDAEWTHLVERARTCGRPPATYIRLTSLGTIPRARPSRADAELIRQLAYIGNNLNQLTRIAHASGCLVSEAAVRTALDELLTVVRRVATA